MTGRDFDRDNKWQKGIRDKILAPQFYENYSLAGRYVFLDKGRLATIIQKRCAADTVVQTPQGAAIFIEEKIVRWPGYSYAAYSLETDSCTTPGHESKGWMHYGKADYLLYCFCNESEDALDCHLIDFQALKEWFWPIHERFKTFRMERTFNKSAGRLVPINDVRRSAVWLRNFPVGENRPPQFDDLLEIR